MISLLGDSGDFGDGWPPTYSGGREPGLEQRLVWSLRQVIELAVSEGLPEAVGAAYVEAVEGVARGDAGWPDCPAHSVQEVDLLMRALNTTLDLAVIMGLPQSLERAYWEAVVGVGTGGGDAEEGAGE